MAKELQVQGLDACGERLDLTSEKSMKVNATGLFICTKIFISEMVKQNSGNIINISSIYGMVGPDFSIYQGTDMDMPPDYAFHRGGIITEVLANVQPTK